MDEMEYPHVVVMEWRWWNYLAVVAFPFLMVGACIAGGLCGIAKAIREVE
jgi:hypothetical protein